MQTRPATATTPSRARARAGAHSAARLASVLSGALAAVVVWAALDVAVSGVRQPGFGGATPHSLTVGAVAAAGLVGGFLGWAALVVTERVLQRGVKTWLTITLTGLVLSLGGPLSGEGIDNADRAALALLHLTVAAVVIPLLYRTTSPGDQAHIEDL